MFTVWMGRNKTEMVRADGGYYVKRTSRISGRVIVEWLTKRGWKRTRGGSHNNRRPSDAVVVSVVDYEE